MRNVLLKTKRFLSRMKDYCLKLYSYESRGKNTVLDYSQHSEEDIRSILVNGIETAVATLKTGKFAEVDNISAKLI